MGSHRPIRWPWWVRGLSGSLKGVLRPTWPQQQTTDFLPWTPSLASTSCLMLVRKAGRAWLARSRIFRQLRHRLKGAGNQPSSVDWPRANPCVFSLDASHAEGGIPPVTPRGAGPTVTREGACVPGAQEGWEPADSGERTPHLLDFCISHALLVLSAKRRLFTGKRPQRQGQSAGKTAPDFEWFLEVGIVNSVIYRKPGPRFPGKSVFPP